MLKNISNSYSWFQDLSTLNKSLVIGGIALALITIIALIIACVSLHKAKNNKRKINNIVKTNNLKEKSINK